VTLRVLAEWMEEVRDGRAVSKNVFENATSCPALWELDDSFRCFLDPVAAKSAALACGNFKVGDIVVVTRTVQHAGSSNDQVQSADSYFGRIAFFAGDRCNTDTAFVICNLFTDAGDGRMQALESYAILDADSIARPLSYVVMDDSIFPIPMHSI
jgi:hypothetical protein